MNVEEKEKQLFNLITNIGFVRSDIHIVNIDLNYTFSTELYEYKFFYKKFVNDNAVVKYQQTILHRINKKTKETIYLNDYSYSYRLFDITILDANIAGFKKEFKNILRKNKIKYYFQKI